MTRARRSGGERGLTLLEILIAASILAIGVVGVLFSMNQMVVRLNRAREEKAASMAVARVRDTLSFVQFRAANAGDTGNWLFRGNYEIARNQPAGTAFLMPDRRTTGAVVDDSGTPLSTADDIGGTVSFEFPVASLQPIGGRTHAGKVVFYINETLQPAQTGSPPVPPAHFPFPATPGLTRLDCDGDGAATTTNLRVMHSETGDPDGDGTDNDGNASTNPCRLVPVKVIIQWRSAYGGSGFSDYQYSEFFLLSHPGRG